MTTEKKWSLAKFKFNNKNCVFSELLKSQGQFSRCLIHCSWMEQNGREWNLELSLLLVVGEMLRDGISWNSHSNRWNMVSRDQVGWLWGSVAVCCGQRCVGVLEMSGGSWAWQFRNWWYLKFKGEKQMPVEKSVVEDTRHNSVMETGK